MAKGRPALRWWRSCRASGRTEKRKSARTRRAQTLRPVGPAPPRRRRSVRTICTTLPSCTTTSTEPKRRLRTARKISASVGSPASTLSGETGRGEEGREGLLKGVTLVRAGRARRGTQIVYHNGNVSVKVDFVRRIRTSKAGPRPVSSSSWLRAPNGATRSGAPGRGVRRADGLAIAARGGGLFAFGDAHFGRASDGRAGGGERGVTFALGHHDAGRAGGRGSRCLCLEGVHGRR